MNKQCYRIIFNKARGLCMAVQENARGGGEGSGKRPFTAGPCRSMSMFEAAGPGRRLCKLAAAVTSLCCGSLWFASPAMGQIIADHSAPGNQQATILNTANGVLQVNVQAPSAGGVSRNTYSQFDVPQNGVVLNNSRTDAQSQLGGWVQANPWLGNGEARIILNEVNSVNPSLLRGFVEVAGSRAEVIIANPAGISVNGGGFINVSRATLTTGTPIFNTGSLDAYAVRGGRIDIDGAGMDASQTDYTDLIARSIVVNAGLWSRQLTVVAGVNEVTLDGGATRIDRKSGDSDSAGRSDAPPRYGIDVSQLGGMYANKIMLVGTEAGIGVHNAGNIGAAAGEAILLSDGSLVNSGKLSASGKLAIQTAKDIDNSGTLHSDAEMDLQAGAKIVNSGTLSGRTALDIQATGMDNGGLLSSFGTMSLAIERALDNDDGTIQARRLTIAAGGDIGNHRGEITQSGNMALALRAVGLINTDGGSIGAAETATPALPIKPEDRKQPAGQDPATPIVTPDSAHDDDGAPAPLAEAAGFLQAGGMIDNAAGQIASNGAIGLAVQNIDNSGGKFVLDNLSVVGEQLLNRDGELNVTHTAVANVATLDNTGGKFLVGDGFEGLLGQFHNGTGLLQAGLLSAAVDGDLDNAKGTLRQTGAGEATLVIGGQFNQQEGLLETADDLRLATGSIAGSAGHLTVMGDLTLDSGDTSARAGTWAVAGNADMRTAGFDNHDGMLSVGKALHIDSAAMDNVGGGISAGDNLTLRVDGALDNNRGIIQAAQDLAVVASGALDNDGGVIEATDADSNFRVEAASIRNMGGRLVNVGSGAMAIDSRSDIQSSGVIAGNGVLAVRAQKLTNQGGSIVSGAAMTLAVSQQMDNLAGSIGSGGTFTFQQPDAGFSNTGTLVAGGTIAIGAARFNNDGGSIATATGSGSDIVLAAGEIDNRSGSIASDRDVIAAVGGVVDNTGGLIQAARSLGLQSGSILDNHQGTIEALAPDGTFSVQASVIDNSEGRLVNAGIGDTTIGGSTSILNSGIIAGNGNLTLTTLALVNATDGTIAAAGNLALAAQDTLLNEGAISSAGRFDFDQQNASFTNSGHLFFAGDASIVAAVIDNDDGQIASANDAVTDIALTGGSLSNRHGQILGARDIELNLADAFDNADGTVQAVRDMQVRAGGVFTNDAGIIEAIGERSALQLHARDIANHAGRIANVGTGDTVVRSAGHIGNGGTIAGNGALLLAAQTMRNQQEGSAAGSIAGIVTAGQAMMLDISGQLDNLSAISSGGTLDFRNAGAAFNNSGTLVAGDTIAIDVADIDNHAGQIATVRGSAADIAVHGNSLRNNDGKILSDRDAVFTISGEMDNSAGIVQAARNTQISAGGTLNNDSGVLEAIDAASIVTIKAAAISNLTGRITNAGSGDTAVEGGASIVNSGNIAGNGNLILSASTLSNGRTGNIAAAGRLQLAVAQQLSNLGVVNSGATMRFEQAGADLYNSGQMVAGGNMDIVAARVSNRGQISTTQSSQADIVLRSRELANSGSIMADRNADFAIAGALDNRQGTLQARADLHAQAGSTLSNGGGAIEAIGTGSALTVAAQNIDNGDGRITNVGKAAVTVASDTLDNSGLIGGNGDLAVTARTVTNRDGGNIVAGGDTNLSIEQQMDNAGMVNSTGKLTFDQVSADLNNSGRINAGGDTVIVVEHLNNDGGQIGTATGSGADLAFTTQKFSNLSGHVVTDRDLSVEAVELLAAGELSAGRDLSLTIQGDYTQTADTEIHANRDFSLDLSGTLTNAAKLEAVRNLHVSAGRVENQAGAIIQAQDVVIEAHGGLDNKGEINAANGLDISADAVVNTNGIVGGDLVIHARAVNNSGPLALLGSTEKMSLWITEALGNTAGANIYSAGSMQIAASDVRDGNGLSVLTGLVDNNSSIIEAAGDLELAAVKVNNIRDNVQIARVATVDETTHMDMASWFNNGDNDNRYDAWSSNYVPAEIYYVNPADILEQSTLVTPDGQSIGRVLIRTHANDSVFFRAVSGLYSKWGHRMRMGSADGTREIYYIIRTDGAANPDQVGNAGSLWAEANPLEQINWDAEPAYSTGYGSCTTNCVRLITQPGYNDPAHIIIRTTQRAIPGVNNSLEVSRDAHHTAVEDQLLPGAGASAAIRSGGNMRIAVGQALNNQYGDIMASGTLQIDGSNAAITNQGTTLYRVNQFDGTWHTAGGIDVPYTMPSISEIIGTASGIISGGQGVAITARSFNNIDTTAGIAVNLRDQVNVIGSGAAGSGANGSNGNGSGKVSNAALADAQHAGSDAINAGLAAITGGSAIHHGMGNSAAGGGNIGLIPIAGASETLAQQGGAGTVIQVAPNGLFHQNPAAGGNYLFETRAAFANRDNWLSSDYLLNALGLDPSAMQKRLGDGFYEQRLVREQLGTLTGRAPDGDSDAQYKALLSAGASYAQAFQLRPGIALTAEQVSHLTSDIVWLESQTVVLPDGSTQTVLVPKVYLAQLHQDSLKSGGALVTGDDVVITAGNIVNRGGLIDGSNSAGTGRTILLAALDISNLGGVIGGDNVSMIAGRDIRNETFSITDTYANPVTSGSYTGLSNQAVIASGNSLVVKAGQDIVDIAGLISAGSGKDKGVGNAEISAGRDISLSTIKTGSTYSAYVAGSHADDSNVVNQSSQLTAGGNLSVAAGRDLTLTGAQVAIGANGSGDGILLAGRDLNINSVTNESSVNHYIDPTGDHYDRAVHTNQTVVGTGIAASGNLALAAGTSESGSLAVTGSAVAAGGKLAMAASGDINIRQAEEKHFSDTAYHNSSSGFLSSSSKTAADTSASTLAIGSSLGGQSVSMNAGKDINISGSEVTAQDALILAAGHDLNVVSAQQSSSESHYLEEKKSGFTLDITEGIGYVKAENDRQRSGTNTTQIGSVLSGGSVSAIAGNDVLIAGSTLIADNDINLVAGRDVSIVSAQDTSAEKSAASSSKSGTIGSRFQGAVGTINSSKDGNGDSITQVGSKIASLGGSVAIKAGEQYTQTASDVLALGVSGPDQSHDISINAKNVTIKQAYDIGNSEQRSAYSKVAIGGNIDVPLVNTVRGAASLAQAATKTSNGRMQALTAATLASKAAAVYEGVNAGIKVSVSLGSSKSENNSQESSSTAVGSTVEAAGNVSIVANGAGQDSDITVVGSKISAGGSVGLVAQDQINLLAAQNTLTQTGSNSSSGASIGIGFGIGSNQNGFTLELAASQARGSANGIDTYLSNTRIEAGNNVSLVSGGDTTLQGAVVAADSVTGLIGGDLNIISLQDSSKFDSKNSSSGFNASICVPPFCYGISTASGSMGKGKVNADYASVTEQSGIKAGDGGFQLAVAGNTDLQAGVISSTDKAVQERKNQLSTGTLTTSDLENHDQYDASEFSISGSVSGKMGDQSAMQQSATDKLGKKEALSRDELAASSSGAPSASSGIGSASGSQSSTTHASISGGDIFINDKVAQQELTGKSAAEVIASLNREVVTGEDSSKSLVKTWDGHELEQEIRAQVQISSEFGAMAAKKVGDFASGKVSEAGDMQRDAVLEQDPVKKAALMQAANEMESNWGEGGAYRVMAHAAAGGLGGGAGGALGAGGSAVAARTIGKIVDGMDLPDAVKQVVGAATAAAIGSAGGLAGLAAAVNGDVNNRQLHIIEIKWIEETKEDFSHALSGELERPVDESEARVWLTMAGEGNTDGTYQTSNGALLGLHTSEEFRAYNAAKKYIAENAKDGFVDSRGQSQKLFVAKGDDFGDSVVYSESRNDKTYRDFYWDVRGDNLKPDNASPKELAIYNAREKIRWENSAAQLATGAIPGLIGGITGKVLDGAGRTAAKGKGGPGKKEDSGPTVKELEKSDRYPDAQLPEADFAARVPVREDLARHLSEAKLSGKNIKGGHNERNFMSVLDEAKGTVISKIEIAPGIHEIQYQLPGKIYLTGYPKKTTYDPSIYSDNNMVNMAQEAAARGMIQYLGGKGGKKENGSVTIDIQVNGVNFKVPIRNESIPTVYPGRLEGK